ncbi:dispersed gene family protein 1 (DGF-1) [Trypanosoma cruzi]|nr:dispersed gene family protein 1 (DGF-1) [Trypanosoma cruzi]
MWSAVGTCPRSRHRVLPMAIAALLVALVLVAAAAWMPAVHAVVLRLRGGTVDRAITVGRAVDTVLMDGVSITNGVAVVFDVAAMLPGALRIELRNCVCDGGAQLYVRGYSGEPASDRSLEVSVSGLSGSYCSLVFVHNLPAHTNVTVRDSTIVTAGPMRYSQLSGLTDAVASPLVLYATSLLQSQLRVSNTVLSSLHPGGSAVCVGGGMELLSSAVVLDGVLLEASGGPTAFAMRVAFSSCLSLRSHSVFSVTNVSVVSSSGGIVLGERLAVFDSVLRFVLRCADGVVLRPRVQLPSRRRGRGVRACGCFRAAACCGHCVKCVFPRGRDGAVGVCCACRRGRGDAAPRCAGRRESGALRAVDGAGKRADRCAERVAAERRRAVRDGRWSVACCWCCGGRRRLCPGRGCRCAATASAAGSCRCRRTRVVRNLRRAR